MNRPPFGLEKSQGICDQCGDLVVIPPGVYYRGRRVHKHCAILLRQQDISTEIVAPFLDGVERDLENILVDDELL